jgi:phospholipid/cholesterol/gamma-HCH transport system substrate-binding protein
MPSAQRVNWAKFRVSVTSLVAILILLTLFYLLTGGTVLSRKVTVYLYLPDGEGLEKDAPVRVDGVDVGAVKTVLLSGAADPKRAVQVVMDVERDRLSQIPANSEAEISSDSLIGDKFVDVTSKPAAAALAAGGELHLKESTELMKAIDIRDLEKQLLEVDTVLRDLEAGRGQVGEFVHGRKMYDDTVKRFSEIEAALRAAVSATTTVGNALYKDELYQRFVDSVTRVDDALARLQSGQGDAGRLLRDPAQYEDLRKSLGGIRKSVADLRASPMMKSDDLYTGWNRSVAVLIQQVDEMNANAAFNTSEAHESLAGMAKEMGNMVREFRSHPEKFLRLKMF